MRNIKSTKLYRRNVAALATHIDRRRFARELRKVAQHTQQFYGWHEHLIGAFVWEVSPQGYMYWDNLYAVAANVRWSPAVPSRFVG